MNRLLCFLALLPAALPAAAASVAARSTITAVTVYTDRAVVTRTANLDLAAGMQEIVFENLPGNLASQSLQVAGRGTAAATILDATARQLFVEAVPNERFKTLADEIRAVQQQVRTLDDRTAVMGEQRELLRRMMATSSGQPAPAPGAAAGPVQRLSLEEWQKLYQYSEDTLGKVAAEIQSLDRQREDLNARIAALQKQLNDLRGAGGKSVMNVTVRLSAASAGGLQLALSYTLPNASWTPAYDARLRSAERAVELSYHGIVRQNTGEDWNNVALTLSTARPSLGGAAPEVGPWIVDVFRPVVYGGDVVKLNPFEVVEQSDRSFSTESVGTGGRAVLDLKKVPAVPEVRAAQMSVETVATSATFKVAAPATVPSDNSPQKIAITTTKLPAKLQYQTAPKFIEAAYLIASATNASDYPLLAGAMNTFLDDVFVASSSLKTVMPTEAFDLALGADEAIGVKRRVVNRFTENTGLTNNGRRVTYEYVVTLTNNRKTAERVTLREPLPKSRDERIVVKLLNPLERDVATASQVKDITREPNGGLAWQLELKPGEKREITLKFSVDYPQEINVGGLE